MYLHPMSYLKSNSGVGKSENVSENMIYFIFDNEIYYQTSNLFVDINKIIS